MQVSRVFDGKGRWENTASPIVGGFGQMSLHGCLFRGDVADSLHSFLVFMSQSSHVPTFEAPTPEYLAEHFPGYDIVNLVACGGMGAVYQAVQRSLDRPVALKILPREFGADASFRAAFEAEAKAMAKLNHPNLIGVYDFGEVDGMLYIIMEYVAGGSLYHASYGSRLDPREAARIVAAVCDGIAHAHEHGILHRDIKPANILLDLQAKPKIGDFGLARPIGTHESDSEAVFGTPHYTAPEVLNRPTAVDARADIFSIGVVLHELLTGQVPAADPRLPSMISGCDLRFDEIVRTATNPVPEMRYTNAAVMAKALHSLEEAIGRATHLVATRPGIAPSRGPAPLRRVVPAQRPTIKQKSGAGVLTTLLILGAVIAAAWYIVKSGFFTVTVPPVKSSNEEIQAPKPVKAPETEVAPVSPAVSTVPHSAPVEEKEVSPFGSTEPPKPSPAGE